ncbi:MAG: phage adsorption protein NrfB [Idiomarina sp.]|nr:phage adsorption protein NrfB [Idiomarina sp.]
MILDIFVVYLYVLKYISIGLLVLMFVFGMDDLFIDIYYWIRTFIRRVTIYRKQPRADSKRLYAAKQRPIAIMVPAWNEVGVVGPMAKTAAENIDYENYEIFVGTYPNDTATQEDVDAVCAEYDHVHKVVCALPGPTSKSDCLNNILASIIEFERANNIQFSGYVLHDAEDMISPMELRLFNYLLANNDLIQVPVYPYLHSGISPTASHYADEFAEMHGKDIPVREALAGQVPSAGVGTGFSRRAILKLMAEGDGLAFDTQSLTEDYDIGFRLRKWGMKEIFVRYSVEDEQATLREKRMLTGDKTSRLICVREHFPAKFSDAVKQKSRWIVGIVFQGFTTHRWTKSGVMNFFLWRDRRGLFANILSFMTMVVFIQLVLILIYQLVIPDSYQFLSIFHGDGLVAFLLVANLILVLNRILQRFIFVTQYYGVVQGVLAIPRIFWSNLVNFFAVIRAIKLVVQVGDARKVAWDKTTHEFPLVMGPRKPLLGQLLVENGLISQALLEDCLLKRPFGTRLGVYLVQQGHVTLQQLCQTIAAHYKMPFDYVDLRELDPALVQRLPQALAYKYYIIPLAFDEASKRLTIGSETPLSAVVKGSLRRTLGLKIDVILVQDGAVSLGLRYLYLGDKQAPPENYFPKSAQFGSAWVKRRDLYYASRESLGQTLVSRGLVQPAVIKQATLSYFSEPHAERFGHYLIQQGFATESAIDEALRFQGALLKDGMPHETD